MKKIPSMAQKAAQSKWAAKTPEQKQQSKDKRAKNANPK